MHQGNGKIPPANNVLIINLAMLMSTGLILLLTFLVPAQRAVEGNTSAPPTKIFFYLGLSLMLVGLAVGHAIRAKGRAALVVQIVALALIDICAVFGLLVHLIHADTGQGRSMIVLAMIGVASLLLNVKSLKQDR